jgi:hypothetical protein
MELGGDWEDEEIRLEEEKEEMRRVAEEEGMKS